MTIEQAKELTEKLNDNVIKIGETYINLITHVEVDLSKDSVKIQLNKNLEKFNIEIVQ